MSLTFYWYATYNILIMSLFIYWYVSFDLLILIFSRDTLPLHIYLLIGCLLSTNTMVIVFPIIYWFICYYWRLLFTDISLTWLISGYLKNRAGIRGFRSLIGWSLAYLCRWYAWWSRGYGYRCSTPIKSELSEEMT